MTGLEPYAFWILLAFIIGYVFIIIEPIVKIDKATTALLMGVICWVIQYAHAIPECHGWSCLNEHLANISQIVFFLLGALAIVEIVNAHKGFAIVADLLRIRSKRKLFWITGAIAFFLSSILDNLTTTIVMVSLLRKLVDEKEDRLIMGSGIVIAANAGGAWTPIGDVTTTMLWIGGQISTVAIMRDLILPSIFCMIVSFFILSYSLKGKFSLKEIHMKDKQLEPKGAFVFFLGVAALIFVPIFKVLTGLPPFMGMFFGFSVLWLVTDLMHHKHDGREHLRMTSALTRIEFSGLLFFLGILLAINALESAKILEHFSLWLNTHFNNTTMLATVIGLGSAIVDNVPLVAATMGMYSLEQYPMNHSLWQLIAYCAGTGGSILIIGSAAGVMFMGLEKVHFYWYLKKISFSALIGFFAGILIYLI